jgi:hypothetical protein
MEPRSIDQLAREFGIHERTLRAAARSGRLVVELSTRSAFGRPIRRELHLTQAELAAKIGAARKAVVYQWESRKRCPSPVFWERIRELSAADSDQ